LRTTPEGGAETVGEHRQLPARERILESACDLIAGSGIDDVRIARVAMRAGVSTALVHHYFSTREELLEQALLHSFELAGDERFGSDDVAAQPSLSATERLARVIRECLPEPGAQEREWVLWVELWLRAVRDPGLRPVATRLYRRYRDWIAAAIAAGVANGEFERVDAEDVADHAMALFDGLGVRALLGDPAMDLGGARRVIAELLGRELGVSPGDLC
jgi:AcrR family transcriptional regulator